VTRRVFIALFFFLFCAVIAVQFTGAQTHENSSASIAAKPADVSGKWQVSWEGRLGTESAVLEVRQDGAKLTGTFQDLHGLSPISGTVAEKQISFDVQFQGKRPFTIRFKGAVDTASNGLEIKGTSQAVGVEGAGAYLGHAGEVVQPEHPWSAKRPASQPGQPAENVSTLNPPARN
jgi:hypothetical protein